MDRMLVVVFDTEAKRTKARKRFCNWILKEALRFWPTQ